MLLGALNAVIAVMHIMIAETQNARLETLI
jgi:hypothetical protein